MVQLRDGGRYRTMVGDEITIRPNKNPVENKTYQWIANNGNTYTDEGGYRLSDFDIIAEVTEEKEESVKDFTIEVGKFYRTETNEKWRCLFIHCKIALMCENDGHHKIVLMNTKKFKNENIRIIGPWVEPLVIHWEMVPPCYHRILVSENWNVYAYADEQTYEGISNEWADHIAPGWREHIGETHYRDGRVEKIN